MGRSHQDSPSSGLREPGPFIIPVDYDALYRMQKPPEYEPFPVYGAFLLSVASQKTPMMSNPWMAVPERVSKTADVIYKQVGDTSLALDVYKSGDGNAPEPLILIIHGGYWKAGDKARHVQNAVEFTDLGYTVAAINYRLSDAHKFPAAIEDIRDAIKYLTDHAADFNIDAEQIVTYGASAGGHLSAFIGLAANTPGKPYVEGINPAAIKGVISLYGMHDLTLTTQREHPFTQQFIGNIYDEASETYWEASPINHVDENDPPVLLIHGSLDGSVSVKNSDKLAAKLMEVGVPYTYDRVEGWSHGMVNFSPIGERILWHCYQFLKTNMPSDKMKNRPNL